MNKTWIMTQKELRSYFDSPAAYIFIVLFLVLLGTYVVGNMFLENVASLRLLFEAAPIVMLLFVPAVTMRLISEEKRGGTFELLGTKSIQTSEIVLGKFFASWFLVICAIVPTFVYAVIISILGNLDWGPVVTGWVGLFLLGGTFVAIGLFASALSNNQIVSLIVGCILISCLFFLDRVLPFLPDGIASSVEYLSAGHHFSSLTRGVIDSRDLVYYTSLIILFVLLATIAAAREYGQRLFHWRHFIPPSRILQLVLVGVSVLLVNLISFGIFFRADLTAGDVYTLSVVTTTQLSSLDDNLLVRAYVSPDLPPPYHNHRRDIQELLEEYHVYSGGKLQYRFVNPLENTDAEQDAIEAGISPIHLKVVKDDKIQTRKAYAGLAFSYADRFESLPVVSSVERLEYDMTRTIKHLRERRPPVVGLLTGHGEPGPEAMRSFLDALGKHYKITNVAFSDWNPSAIAALLVIGPRRRFEEQEKGLLDQYITRGGRVAFFLDAMIPDRQRQSAQRLDLNLGNLFDMYGWNISNDLVVDMHCDDFGANRQVGKGSLTEDGPNPFFPVVADFDRDNPTVANLPPIVFPYVSSIDPRLAAVRGIDAKVVASSSSRSDRVSGDSIDINPASVTGRVPFGEEHIPLAATFEGSFRSAFGGLETKTPAASANSTKNTRAKIVVVGDGDFVLDASQHGYQNITFALNLVDWLLDDSGLGSIRTRDIASPPLHEVSDGTRTTAKYFAFAGPPALVILGGLIRVAMRASRRRKHTQGS